MSAWSLLRTPGVSALCLLVLSGTASPQSRDIGVVGPAGPNRPEVFLQLGHTAFVGAIAISPDGRTLASASGDRTVKLWDIATGRQVRTLTGFSDGVNGIAFTPDGRTLASDASGQIRLWDVATGREVRRIDAYGSALAFSPDGRILLATALGVTLLDPATGQKLRETVNLPSVTSVAFAPDGKTFASGGYGETVRLRLWETATAKELRTFIGHRDTINAVAFSPAGHLLASASSDGTVKLWDPRTGRETRTLAGHSKAVFSVAFSPDGQILASGASDQTIGLWDVATGQRLRTLTGHAGGVWPVAFAPDGRALASGSWDRTVKLWDVATGREQRTFAGRGAEVDAMAVAPDGRTVVSAGDRHDISVWDVATGREVRRLTGHAGRVHALAFTPDGRTLGSGSADRTVRLWEMSTGRELRALTGHTSEVKALAFAPDGRSLASGSPDGTIALWDPSTGRRARTLNIEAVWVAEMRPLLAFAPDGRTLASTTGYKAVQLWDLATGRMARELTRTSDKPLFFILNLAFAPDGGTIATTGSDNSGEVIKFWDVATGHERPALSGHAAAVWSVAFSPDGRTLASGGGPLSRSPGDTTIKLWDLGTRRELRTLEGHSGAVRAVSFMPGGRTLASASEDTTVRLWDPATGKERVTLISFADGSHITVTPEGYYDVSSEQAEENLNVRVGREVFGIGAFRERFYRPDLVKLALAGHSLDQFARLEGVKSAPAVELLDAPATTTQRDVTLKVRLTDTGGGIGDVRLFLNGSAVQQVGGRDIAVTGPARSTLVRSFTVQLVNGRNELRAVAFNADNSMEGRSAAAEITAVIRPSRPSLYGLAVGIQQFRNPRLNLKYPVADARLFADTVRRMAAPLFQTVDIALLTTAKDTTRDSVREALRRMRQKAGPDDLFVFFVASHGTVDDGEYFLITSNVGSISTDRLKSDALSQTDLKDLLANIPATKKLVVIDTCSAAALGNTLQVAFLTRGLNEETALKILARAVGSTVLSASTSTQQALEGYRGHGLLTHAIAEGLSGRADVNRDGFVSTLELAAFVEDAVPSIAEREFRRAQYATVSKSGQGFPLVKVR